VTLLAFAAERRPCRAASIDIFWLTAANPPYAAAAVYSCDGQTNGRTDERTDRRTPYRYRDPVEYYATSVSEVTTLWRYTNLFIIIIFFVFFNTPGSKDPRG